MNAIETAPQDEPEREGAPAAARPGLEEVTSWLLEGRFFTIDVHGRVTLWSVGAQEAFGWSRRDVGGTPFVEVLLAEDDRPPQAERVASLFERGGSGCAELSGQVTALDASGGTLGAEFALVPIPVSAGYEFNGLLTDISTRSGDKSSLGELRGRHDNVLSLIEAAITGKAAEDAQTEEGGRLAGALVAFTVGSAPAAPDAEKPDNVVSIADAASAEETRAQLERARREVEEARVELRNLEGQLEEARREAQRGRNEVDVARQEASDARDVLVVAQREAEQAKRKLDDAKREADTALAGAEAARMRAEEAQREADRLRLELREARESARGAAGRADDELAKAAAEAERAARDLADARAAAEGRGAEVESLRERLQASQRELGMLRGELEAARADAAEGLAVSTRRAEDLERVRSELGDVRGELNQLRVVLERAPLPTAVADASGRWIEVNAAFCDAIGHPAAVLLGDSPPEVVHPDDAEASREVARRVLTGHQPAVRGFRRYLHADGHPVTMREHVAALPGPDGRPALLVVQLDDAPGDEGADHVVIDAELAPDEPPVAGGEALSIESMRRAVQDDMFELHCQPLLDLHTNEVSQYELLIRLVTEDGRRMLPEAFLGAARRAGLASAIDRWVVRQAIQLIARAQEAGTELTLEVNLSPEAVHDPDLPAAVEAELATVPIDPARLVLEVTGQTAVDSLDETRTMAKRLRALGCRFALDDFRSTFGSFRLLKDLPLDFLKIDGELVESLSESRTSQLIVKALVDVSAGTGTKTVAVFVSDEDTLGLLRQQGVDYAQGYRIGRPRPVGETDWGTGRSALPAG